ncbi:MAG TPA: FmdE family protein [Anaeromyxobacteraceae bacterium]|jgi:formylmethanofuran dehydrogenase subunit E|nr:FmdE family protein [Anaeromyxobacteraceae bacterium]
MDLLEYVRAGTLAHGHNCPPLVLGVRAGAVAMDRLGVGHAVEHELLAFVELGSDHYAQGFADGVQFVTGCTFGKDLIFRLPYGKAGVQLVEQARQRAIRVTVRPETLARLEETDWFRACQTSGRFAGERVQLAELTSEALLTASEDALFTVGPVFPLGLDRPSPTFESVRCEACGESVLAPYAPEVGGRRLCPPCEERRRARALFVSLNSGREPEEPA